MSVRQVFVTADGARTWRHVVLPPVDRPLQVAVGGGSAYLLAGVHCPAPPRPCAGAAVWSLSLHRASARLVATVPAAGSAGSSSSAFTAHGDDLWVVLGLGAGKGVARRSTDGGRTWRPFTSDVCLSDGLTATAADVLWSTCVTGMMQHFDRQVGGAPSTRVIARDLSGTSDSTLMPLGASTAMAVLSGPLGDRLVSTHDGGRSVSTGVPFPAGLQRRGFRIAMVSDRVGYLVTLGGGAFYTTHDGGLGWTEIARPRS